MGGGVHEQQTNTSGGTLTSPLDVTKKTALDFFRRFVLFSSDVVGILFFIAKTF